MDKVNTKNSLMGQDLLYLETGTITNGGITVPPTERWHLKHVIFQPELTDELKCMIKYSDKVTAVSLASAFCPAWNGTDMRFVPQNVNLNMFLEAGDIIAFCKANGPNFEPVSTGIKFCVVIVDRYRV